MKNQVLVQEIVPTYIYFGPGSKDNGRFAEILPLEGKRFRPGTEATFFDRQGRKISGKVVDWRTQGDNVSWEEPGSQVVDTL